MAERKRRGEDAVDDRLDEAFDDDTAVDEDLADDELDEVDDEVDDEFDDDDDDEDEDEPVAARSRGGRGTLTRAKADGKTGTRPGTRGRSTRPADRRPTKSKSGDRRNIFARVIARFVNFVREVVAELRKVIWPTRKELLTYTAVVVVFVTLMLSIVAGLDWVFTQGVIWVFGNKETAAGS